MRLADFIVREMATILARWEAFAATQTASAGMTPLALRDHAQQILEAVAKDLGTFQSREAQVAKSKGLTPLLEGAPETAAQTHAVLRARSGFDINQLAAEYRALRASVLSLWMGACDPADLHLGDLVRFNEAIDQALAESIAFFSEQVDRARNLLIGTLGHDMRSPLQTIMTTAGLLRVANAGPLVSQAASHLLTSGDRMTELINDLLDFSRTQLGVAITIAPTDIDLAEHCAEELEQLRAAHPDRTLTLEVTGTTRGTWDGAKLQRVLRNLVENAVKYGFVDTPVHVRLLAEPAGVRLEVSNTGPVIPPATLAVIFEPLARGPRDSDGRGDEGLGLGLYIALEIAKAHGGDLTARSSISDTTFTLRLPHSHGPADAPRMA